MCTKDQIDKTIFFADGLNHMLFLHHTTAQGDHHMRIFLFLIVQIAQMSIDLVVGIFTHGTGIVEHKIRILGIRLHIADLL